MSNTRNINATVKLCAVNNNSMRIKPFKNLTIVLCCEQSQMKVFIDLLSRTACLIVLFNFAVIYVSNHHTRLTSSHHSLSINKKPYDWLLADIMRSDGVVLPRSISFRRSYTKKPQFTCSVNTRELDRRISTRAFEESLGCRLVRM